VRSRVSQFLRGHRAVAAALIAAAALLGVPAGASAASPVLEFVVPGNTFPVSLTTAGGEVKAEGFSGAVMTCAHSSGQGEITGPRRAIAKYEFTECKTGVHECKSEGAGVEEIKTGLIEAELVYIDQAKHEVAVLLNPHGGTYMKFECEGIPARGEGPFLAPGSPLNTETTSFTTTLSKSSAPEGVQTPDEYEGAGGEKLKAIPLGEKNNNNLTLEPTGVESTITVTTAEPVEVRAITAEEVEAKQREEAKKQEEALQTLEATLKKQEEALKKAEEHAKQVGEETKKHEAELNAQIAAIKKHQEEEAAKKKQEEVEKAKSKSPTRAQLLSKALKQCKKEPKNKRAQCEVKAKKKYGHKAKTSKK
jgi:hypothetical protein